MSTELPPSNTGESTTTLNVHSWLRKLFFIACIVVFLLALLYLIYHNGKSIYDNGI